MPRLVFKAGSAEIRLRPGVNALGRNPANDFQIPDASVSSSHCQITVTGTTVLLRDLGSTNGSFVDGTQVVEAALEHGQTIRLGDVELLYYADATEISLGPVAVEVTSGSVAASPPLREGPATAMLPRAAPTGAQKPIEVGAQFCRFHLKMPARYLCEHCEHYFCEACVATRSVSGKPHKFCRHCGGQCVPVLAQFAPTIEKGFFGRIPGAFVYPLRGVGVIIVIVGIVLVALLKLGEAAIEYRTIRMIMFGVVMEVFVGGYLFTFLQAIIHATEAGDKELPDLPGIGNFMEDVIVPFGRLLTLTLMCFGPAIGVAIWLAVTKQPMLSPYLIGTVSAGYLYFPMAFLAVATLDSLAGANPLVVMPSMLRAPAEYVVSLLILAAVFGVQIGSGLLLKALFPESWITHGMGALFAMLGLMAFLSFLSLYLLLVGVHLLGLIFVTKKEQLGWLDR